MRRDLVGATPRIRFARRRVGTSLVMTAPTLRRVSVLASLLAAGAVALALPQPSSAAPAKLIVSPGKGSISARTHALRMRLSVGERTRVTSANFYSQGQLVTVDKRAPFTTVRGSSINLSGSPAGPTRLSFKVVYKIRRPGGRIVSKSVSRRIRVVVFRPPSTDAPLPTAYWRPAFNDDFSSAAVSNTLWKTQRDDWIKNGIPYSNLEGAGYLTSNVSVANGTMNISTSNRAAAGFTQSTGSVNTNKKFAFKYGYLEARILVPRCNGCWPAFWMLPSADHWPPEIDIIEYFNTAKQGIPYSAVHWPMPEADKEDYFSERLMHADTDNYVGQWHTYGVLWSASSVQFYLDGALGPVFSEPSKIPHLPMYPIIQLAVGNGYRPGPGHTMQVDYVRAWVPAN